MLGVSSIFDLLKGAIIDGKNVDILNDFKPTEKKLEEILSKIEELTKSQEQIKHDLQKHEEMFIANQIMHN